MPVERIISFTSDFGDADGYVGIVKGAILSVNKDARIVDICHDVKPYNISSAAWIIYNAFNYFPPGTIHLVVVDPGVGSEQRRILLKQGEHSFVGPDNGVFSLLIQDPLGKRSKDEGIEVWDLLEGQAIGNIRLSSTFHARDLFGPVAAKLSLGIQPTELGKTIDIDTLDEHNSMKVEVNDGRLSGCVIHIDRFGNLITNIANGLLDPESCYVVGDQRIEKIVTTYRAVRKGQLLAVKGSHGFLEIAVCEGRADDALEAEIGTVVEASAAQP